MSYWFERMTKKHIFLMLGCIPWVICNNFCNAGSSYCSGCLATASRTLYDWISVDASTNAIELVPFVHMAMETGCIEWLGFSTCETVQFRTFMKIWATKETMSVHIFNITNAASVNEYSQVTTTAVPSFDVGREYLDDGIAVSAGQLTWKRRLLYTQNFDESRLQDNIITMNANSATSGLTLASFTKVKAGNLLGFFQGGAGYFDISSKQPRHETLVAPSGTNKNLNEKSLYYYSSTNTDGRKCTYDDDCGNACVWTPLCQPRPYGHEGTIMPSGNHYFDYKGGLLELNQWPLKAWDFAYFCPWSAEQANCKKMPRKVLVFNPDSSAVSFFDNTGEATAEKFPDLSMHLWKHHAAYRRTEGCDGVVNLGGLGKDCGVPAEYVFSFQDMYLSNPKDSSGNALLSEIYSEKVTGLRFDYRDVFQLNRRITATSFLPLFWVDRKPVGFEVEEQLNFSALKTYGDEITVMFMIGFIGIFFSLFFMLYVLFHGISCVAYCSMMSKEWEPFAPNYI